MAVNSKSADGKYHIKGEVFELLLGTRAQVWHKTAYKTTGGLRKSDLVQTSNGRIVSKAKHITAKKEQRLLKHGYGTQKGKFGYVKVDSNGSRKSRKSKGGQVILGGAVILGGKKSKGGAVILGGKKSVGGNIIL
jgi:uncharacterized protein with NRDE domain